jgi:hypothetical protein
MDRAKFFAAVRAPLFAGKLAGTQVSGTDAILDEAERRGTPLAHLAYMLATAYHETAHTMQPIAEYGRGKGRKYGVSGKHGQAPYGRGYVQLTWDVNYERADKELGLKGALLRNFDLAMRPDIAAKIMFVGMTEGWFTGKKLADYIGENADYVGARRIINGTDKAEKIAGYAATFEAALRSGGYGYGTTKPTPTPAPAVPAKIGLAALIAKIIAAIFGAKK